MDSTYSKGIDQVSGTKSTIFNPDKPQIIYNSENIAKLKNGEEMNRKEFKLGFIKSPGEALIQRRRCRLVQLEEIKREKK